MNARNHTPGPWYWHTDHAGRVSLRTPDRGQLIVADFARKGMQGAEPRLAYWPGIATGAPRERMGGILQSFAEDHPDARLIAAAPDLLDVIERLLREEDAGDGFSIGLIEDARAALAKVEGEL